MASTVEHTASCALCRRHLLVGEPARLYQDPASKRFLKVCPLCYERAERRGWRADGTPIVAVHANPPKDHLLRERENLIDRLRGQLQSVEFDLDQVRTALAKAEQQAGELRTVKREMKELTGELRRRERELRQLTEAKRRGDEARRPGRGRPPGRDPRATTTSPPSSTSGRRRSASWRAGSTCSSRSSNGSGARYAELAEARRQEGDAAHTSAGWRWRRSTAPSTSTGSWPSPAASATRSCTSRVDGCDLPRAVRITVAWDISWYEYLVRLDLHEQTVTRGRGARAAATPRAAAGAAAPERRAALRPDRADDAGVRRRAPA